MAEEVKVTKVVHKVSNYNFYQIDKGFRPIIKILNAKGWITVCCCEGHTDKLTKKSEQWNGYLIFTKDYDFPIPIPLYNVVERKDHPSKIKTTYSMISKRKNGKGINYYWYGSKGTTIEQKENERLAWMKEMLRWATELPYYPNNEKEN